MLTAPCDDRQVCRITCQSIHTQLLLIGAFGMFSLTALPCRMRRISFDLRSYAAQGPVSTGAGGPPGRSSGCCQLLLVRISFNFAGADFLALSVWGLAPASQPNTVCCSGWRILSSQGGGGLAPEGRHACVCGLLFPFVEAVAKVFVQATPKGVGALPRWVGRPVCVSSYSLL